MGALTQALGGLICPVCAPWPSLIQRIPPGPVLCAWAWAEPGVLRGAGCCGEQGARGSGRRGAYCRKVLRPLDLV